MTQNKPVLFVTRALPDSLLSPLFDLATLVRAEKGFEDPLFLSRATEFDALLVQLTDPVTEAVLSALPRLRIVSTIAVGYDNIDVAGCKDRGIIVTHTPGVLTEATADLALALLLSAARRVAEADRYVRAGRFQGWSPSLFVGQSLFGKKLGIVGMGRIGRAVCRRALGFGMKVVYTKRTRLPVQDENAIGASYEDLDTLFRSSDFVSLHCPLHEGTRHLVDAKRLSSMKRGAILINTARGACVEEAALAHALHEGTLGGAGLDVFEDEPHVHPALLAHERVVLTPHIASADRETREKMVELAVLNLRAWATGSSPPHIVPNPHL